MGSAAGGGRLDARTILDLSCGTGLLTRDLASLGRCVVRVDPSPAMLAFARQQQPGAVRIEWVEGKADWLATLAAIHAALRRGAYLAFKSPEDRAGERDGRACQVRLAEQANRELGRASES